MDVGVCEVDDWEEEELLLVVVEEVLAFVEVEDEVDVGVELVVTLEVEEVEDEVGVVELHGTPFTCVCVCVGGG